MYVLGTAGHVDHGKSSFLKLLTGMEPDRLPEERKRGMTIDLNFLHYQSKNFGKVGIVDVPGHESFTKNFTTGVSAMDAFVFVVAADDGWMPQSTEHLNILKALNIKKGICILSKIDLVETFLLNTRLSEIDSQLKNVFEANIPIFQFSIHDSKYLMPIKNALEDLLGSIQTNSSDRVEVWIDRIFSPKGIGKVVTGTLRGGKIEKGSCLYLHPKNIAVDIKGIQSFGEAVESTSGTTRVALQLSIPGNFSPSRGMLLSKEPQRFQCSVFDVSADFFSKPLKRNTSVSVHLGTLKSEALAIPLISGSAFCRIKMLRPIPIKIGDRILLRSANEQTTLAGASVLEVDPPTPHKKSAAIYQTGVTSLNSYLRYKQNIYPILDLKQLLQTCPWTEIDFHLHLSRHFEVSNGRWMAIEQEEWFYSQLEGKTELSQIRTLFKKQLLAEDIDCLYNHWLKNQRLKSTRTFSWDQESTFDLSAIKRLWLESKGKPFDTKPLGSGAQKALKQLCGEKILVALGEGFYIDFQSLETYRLTVVDFLRKKGSASTSELKDVLKLSRRPSVLVLERLDTDRITYLKNNVRQLLRNYT